MAYNLREQDEILTGAIRARMRRSTAEPSERMVEEIMSEMAFEAERGDERVACRRALALSEDTSDMAYRRYRRILNAALRNH